MNTDPVTSSPPFGHDGVDGLMHKLETGLPDGRIPAAIFGSPAVHARELRQVFGRCWVYLAHESEIPNHKDFVLRKIGEDSFIVARDRNGEIQVMLNACRHRGVKVCRPDSGSTGGFVCPYHGWVYNLNGDLVGAPVWGKAFGDMPKAENGLLHAAQVATCHGLIFATLDPTAPPLDTYLGGMKWYLDMIFGLNEHGVEVLAPPQRIILDANWKSSAENFAGDDYHLGTLHRSAIELGSFPMPFEQNMEGFHIQAHPGHSLSFSVADSPDDPGPKFYGYPEEIAATFNTSRISPEQLALAHRARVGVGTIFPNFSFLVSPHTDDPAHPPTAMLSIRVWQPHGPDKIEVWNWFCAYRNMTPDQKKRLYKAALGSFSVAGLFEIDDTEPWGTVRETGQSVAAELLDMQLNYQMGLPGVGVAKRVEDWPGPGVVYAPRYDEGVQRNLYRFYRAMMQAPAGTWPTVALV